eukprot:jgi/Picre1/27462/NNA_000429.t1
MANQRCRLLCAPVTPSSHGIHGIEAIGICTRGTLCPRICTCTREQDYHAANTGWKIVFSGDTRPCPQLVTAAKHATLLIHEATFEDTMKDEAIEKNHCTGEAIAAGEEAQAYTTLLTHFSQRYPKIPVIDETTLHSSNHVGVAFDLMTVRLSTFLESLALSLQSRWFLKKIRMGWTKIILQIHPKKNLLLNVKNI